MQHVLKTYLKRLTNLTASNRSLVLLRLYAQQFIDVHALDFAAHQPSFEIIKSLMGRKQTIALCPISDPRDELSNKLSTQIRRLSRFERFLFEEQGSRDLYVGWPFVHGKFSDGTIVRCPLMFFPVEIAINNDQWVLKQREEVNVTFNKSFLLAYGYFNGVQIEDDLVDRVFDDFDTDSTVFRTALYQVLKESPVQINFNPETFEDQLKSFNTYKRDEFESQHKDGVLKVVQEAVVGIFPQAGSQLVPDYLHMIANETTESIEEFFLKGAETTHTASPLKEERVITPYAMDAYQEMAVQAVAKGMSVVVQGPPGTGKSQMICNLAANAMAAGKTVLVVSQKRAALDVVFERLEEKEITPHVGLIHDFKNDRKTLYEQVAREIDRIESNQKRDQGLDIIQLERTFQTSSRTIDRIVEELDEYKHALFDDSECGLSAKELYLTSDRQQEVVNLKNEYSGFLFGDHDRFIKTVRNYFENYHRFSDESYVWSNRKSFHKFGLDDLKRIQEYLGEIPIVQKKTREALQEITGKSIDLDECFMLRDRKDVLRTMFEIIREEETYTRFQTVVVNGDGSATLKFLSDSERIVADCFRNEGVEASLSSGNLGAFSEVLERAREARKSLPRYFKWRYFSKEKFYVKRVLVANGLKLNRQGLNNLAIRLDNRMNLEHNLSLLREKPWIKTVPGSYRKVDYQQWFDLWKEAIRARDLFLSVRNFKEYFAVQNFHYDEFYSKVDSMFKIIEEVTPRMSQWLQHLSAGQINSIISDPDQVEVMLSTLDMDFDSLCEFDSMVHGLSKRERGVLGKLADHDASMTPDLAVRLYENSIRTAWIDHIETKYPILRNTASGKFGKMVAELQEAVELKAEHSTDILLLKLREKAYENADYNRLKNMTTYRDLYHQVTKKRRIWPLRKLMANEHQALFNLIPCWLASPESVSAIFPMSKVFDLVIFDEASQCFAERGLLAIYRGKQTVVAGDDKQLQPNDLYQMRWDDDTIDDAVLEIDSLLNLASPYLHSIQLKGHYRSKSLDLIDFSNQYFYDGSLTMLPDKVEMDSGRPGINYVKVEGCWENNTNQEEANKVIEIIRGLVEEGKSSIGVVTFNARQQVLISDMLEQQAESGLVLPEALFVKNIENVQGDERDIIVFSTAYAKDKHGKLRMQFGSLNIEGGENRLNVAITRAREKVVIVTSILPGQMNVDQVKNTGPKLLKAYLEYALKISEGEFKPALPDNKSHNATWYLKSKLQSDYTEAQLVQTLPFADLTMTNGKMLGLVLTDDDLYYQSVSAKDAFVYKPAILREKHWDFFQVHSRDYWRHASGTLEKLSQFHHRLV